MAIADKLTYLNETKTRLRRAINNAGGGVSLETPFRSYVGEILRDQSTLLLDFETGVYGSGESATKRNDSQSFTDLISFSRSTTAGFFNQFGLYETAAIDQPRIDHDPATLGSSTDTLTIGLGIKVINTDYEYPIGDVVVVSYDATNFMIGKVLASSATAVTLNVVTVVGSGTYSTWTLIVRLGLLVEERRANRVVASTPGDGWSTSPTNYTVASPTNGPLGIDLALVTRDTTASSVPISTNGFSATVGATYTLTTHLLAGTSTSIAVGVGIGNDGSGIWGATTDTSASVISGPGVVSRLVGALFQVDGLSTDEETVIRISRKFNTATSVQGLFYVGGVSVSTPGLSCYIGGVQIEEGTFPTSHIPTAGAAVTRAGDVPRGVGLNSWFNPVGGTAYVEFNSNRPIGYAFDFYSTTNTDRIIIRNNSTSVSAITSVDGAVVNTTNGTGAQTTRAAAVVYGGGELALSVDGGLNSSSGGTPSTIDSLLIGNANTLASANNVNGHIKSIRYIPRRLTDEELSIITS